MIAECNRPEDSTPYPVDYFNPFAREQDERVMITSTELNERIESVTNQRRKR